MGLLLSGKVNRVRFLFGWAWVRSRGGREEEGWRCGGVKGCKCASVEVLEGKKERERRKGKEGKKGETKSIV